MLAAWTIIILASAAWNIYDYHQDTLKRATIEAETYFDLNLSYRKWNSQLGGVYAPMDKVAPNPYLLVSQRDIKTEDGRNMTLVNPAYMTRMTFDIVKNKSEIPVICKLTSLKYLNPNNAPDNWEKAALFSFEKSTKEAKELTTINNQPYLRIIKPFYMEESCLKCHGHQGYRVGDVRGGLSIAIPFEPYRESETRTRGLIIFTHFLLWLMGSTGLVFFTKSREKQQKDIEEREWMFRTLSEFAYDWEFWLSEENKIIFTSPSCKELTGYSQEEFSEDPDLLANIIHPDEKELWMRHVDDFKSQQHDERDFRIVRKDGQIRWISHFCGPVYRNGKFLGRRASNRDITKQKLAEKELMKSEHSLAKAQEIAHIGNWEWDLETNNTYWSDEACRILGLNQPQSGAAEDVFFSTAHADDRDSLQRAVREASGGGNHLSWIIASASQKAQCDTSTAGER